MYTKASIIKAKRKVDSSKSELLVKFYDGNEKNKMKRIDYNWKAIRSTCSLFYEEDSVMKIIVKPKK